MKRLVAMIMGISICGSLLSGCGGTDTPKETSSKAASEGTEKQLKILEIPQGIRQEKHQKKRLVPAR